MIELVKKCRKSRSSTQTAACHVEK